MGAYTHTWMALGFDRMMPHVRAGWTRSARPGFHIAILT
jgi:hypothetical protein